jgi:hypothetical protein
MRKMLMSLFAVLLVAAIWGGTTFLDRHRDQTETIEELRYQLNELKTMIARSEEPQDADPAVQACLEEVRTAHKGNVQQVTEDLVRAASGNVTGEVADAVLHLLSGQGGIKRCFVMRAMAQGGALEIDPRVVTRCLEIAREVPATDYDCAYFFSWLAPLIDPKSDDLVDFTLDRAMTRTHANHEYLDTLRVGLTDTQLERCANRVIDGVEATEDKRIRVSLLTALLWLARKEHASRLEAMAADDAYEEQAQTLAKQAADNANRHP